MFPTLHVRRVSLLVGFAMSGFAVLTQLSSPQGSRPPRYLWLFAPRYVGDLLVGGPAAPMWLRASAWIIAIAGTWTLATYLAVSTVQWLRSAPRSAS